MSDLVTNQNVVKINLSCLLQLANENILDVNIFSLFLENRVFNKCNGALVVT